MIKVLCIKNGYSYKIGDIYLAKPYSYPPNMLNIYDIFNINGTYLCWETNGDFITLAEFREQRIEKILK